MIPLCPPVLFDGWRSISISLHMTLEGYGKVFAMCASAAMVHLLIYGAMYLWLRKAIPALAKVT